MRCINVRLKNYDDVEKLSNKLKVSLHGIGFVKLEKTSNLFDLEYMIEIKKANVKTIRKIDINKYEWIGMPKYESRSIFAYAHIKLYTSLTNDELSKLFAQNITNQTKSIWYPKNVCKPLNVSAWLSSQNLNPQYPIYIISKGRPNTCKTAKTLDWMGIDYNIVVEPSEAKQYRTIWGDRVMVGNFDTTTRSSIPVRNWVNEHCNKSKYWLLDDNINFFYILNNNRSLRCKTGAIFRIAEDFANQFTNIAITGFNKLGFCKPTDPVAPYVLNTRVYSMSLLDKNINEQIKINGALWRGRYNEDTDLCLRFLKAGYCTVNWQMLLGDKATTQTMRGGNTDNVYVDGDKRYNFAKSLMTQHPDLVTITEKWGRYHHHVNWDVFKQKLIRKKTQPTITNYGLYVGPYEAKQ